MIDKMKKRRFINHDAIIEDTVDNEQYIFAKDIVDKMNELDNEIVYYERKKCEYFNEWSKTHSNYLQYKKKLKETLQKHYDENYEGSSVSNTIQVMCEIIAEEMGVILE